MFWHPIYKELTSVWDNMSEEERKLCRDLVHSCEYRKDAITGKSENETEWKCNRIKGRLQKRFQP